MSQEWIKLRYRGGQPPVWHLPNDYQSGPKCCTQPLDGHIEKATTAEILPEGPVCKWCVRLFVKQMKNEEMNRIRKELLRIKLKEQTICRNAQTVKSS
jgi:hypothetical protein